GANLNGFYYLQSGKVAVTMIREDGFERMIDIVYPRSLIGEQMIYGTPSFTTTQMMENSTLYFFSKETFQKLCEKDSQVMVHFSYSFLEKIRLLAQINAVINASAEVQIAHFLYVLRKKQHANDIKLTQTQLANYIGKSRVTIWKVFKKWKQDGIVLLNDEKITIKNERALQEKIIL